MVDKRIKKTKKNLKATLISMMSDTPFEEISITSLCKQADISRITFYTHYSDKYALIDDIFQDMIQAGTELYQIMQEENNPERDYVKGYCNVLQAILKLYYTHYDFFCHTRPDKNPFLAFSFYNYVLKTVESHTNKESRSMHFRYTPRKVAGFICYGMTGFINESHSENIPLPEIQKEALELLTSLLTSDVLTK
ncbi:TetR/AcrR family transcriptional regulator [Mediterraneibacter agrestimuris]|uniref:TetR/AcrR family transcriptional regulator n=1 Tax=Mediterraneibacter agrestimuris TaxID=2941333 RepID=UPI00203C748B|nr:TetR/AcrR family transcriptional regulator [Mediterraneibacter agrestimuris]